MAARRLAHWTAVGAAGVVGVFAVQLAAHRFPQLGLAKFASFLGGGSN